MYGPADPTLWLIRKVGYWESRVLGYHAGRYGHNICNHLTQINTCDINQGLFKQAVVAVVHNEPNLRCDVRVEADGSLGFTPATDFSEIFEYLDYSSRAPQGYQAGWDIAEQRTNKVFSFGVGKPLYRCTLLKLADCYLLMNQYNHAVADGTSGQRITGGILAQYDSLIQGNGVIVEPKQPLPSTEDLVDDVTELDQPIIEDMLVKWRDRARNFKHLVPVDLAEVARNDTPGLQINGNLHREGSVEGFSALLARCRKEDITIGAFSIAATLLAEAALYVRSKGGDVVIVIPPVVSDMLVNLRNRFNPPIGETINFCISELKLDAVITNETTVWSLAKEMKLLMNKHMERKEHLWYVPAKERFETEDKALVESVKIENVGDCAVSNMTSYMFPTEYSWGKISSMFILGSYWTPPFSNYFFLYQTVNSKICYNMCYNDGPNNRVTATNMLEIITGLMEGTGDGGDDTIADLI